jgi:hypothetical protein
VSGEWVDVTGLRGRFNNRTLRISSAFSGILTPELAAQMFASAVNTQFGFDAGDGLVVVNVQAIECHGPCQEEILHMPAGDIPTHVYTDILCFLPASIRDDLKQMNEATDAELDAMKHRILQCTLQTTAWCCRRGGYCTMLPSDLHIAGTPCVDFSSMNASRKLSRGPKMKLYWVWIKMRRTYLERVWVHENVPSFGTACLEADLGDLYFMFRIVLCPTMLGWATRRKRQFTLGVRKDVPVSIPKMPSGIPGGLENIYDFLFANFFRNCNFDVRHYRVATQLEVAAERCWAASRSEVLTFRHADADPYRDDAVGSMCAALNPSERKRLHNYFQANPSSHVDLAQEQGSRGDHSGSLHGPMMCLTRGIGLVYDMDLQRWYTTTEMAVAMGYPVRGVDDDACGHASLFSRSRPSCPHRTRASAAHALGNAMHVNSIGAIIGSLLCWFPLGVLREDGGATPSSTSSFGSLLARRRNLKRLRSNT